MRSLIYRTRPNSNERDQPELPQGHCSLLMRTVQTLVNVCSKNRSFRDLFENQMSRLLDFIFLHSKCKTKIKSLSTFLTLICHCSSGWQGHVTAVMVHCSIFLLCTSKEKICINRIDQRDALWDFSYQEKECTSFRAQPEGIL